MEIHEKEKEGREQKGFLFSVHILYMYRIVESFDSNLNVRGRRRRRIRGGRKLKLKW